MTVQTNDSQAYKQIAVHDIKNILSELNKALPWLVADIAISVQNRLGANNQFTQKILNDVLANLSEEDLLDISAECLPYSDVNIWQVSTATMAGTMGAQIDSDRLRAIFARPAFSLDEESSDNCSPCDGGETGPIAMGILGGATKAQFKKIKLAQHISADIEKLMVYKTNMLNNPNEFQDEIVGINTIIEVIDARCQK